MVTKFEKDNPVKDALEVFVDNPLCPNNKVNFWATTLQPFIDQQKTYKTAKNLIGLGVANNLIAAITNLYKYWNKEHCKGEFLYNVGLHNEAYFKYFNYADFVRTHSGLIQIKKYAEINMEYELLAKFDEITKLTKAVKQEIYRMLIEDFEYFK